MASAVATHKLRSCMKVEMFHHAPADAATEQSVKAGATAATWKDLSEYGAFLVMAMLGLKTGDGLIELSIYAATDTSGTNATEIKTSGAVAADAVGDYVVLECSAAEIAQIGRAAGLALRYVAGYVDCNHNDDEVEVTYIRCEPRFPQLDLTANTIA